MAKKQIEAPEQPLIRKMLSPFQVDLEMNKVNKFDQQWYQVVTPDRGVIDCRSVTTILKMAHPIDPGLIKYFKKNGEDSDRIRDEAGQRGSAVHKLIELTLTGNPVSFENEANVRSCSLEEWEIYLMWCRWYQQARKEEELKVLYVEQMVYDLDARIAGTVDLICDTNKGRRIKDWKTGGIYQGDIQVSKYVDMLNRLEMFGTIDGADIVQLGHALNKKGFRETEIENIPHNVSRFNLDLEVFNINFPDFAPKYKSYPNTVTLEMLDGEESIFEDEKKGAKK